MASEQIHAADGSERPVPADGSHLHPLRSPNEGQSVEELSGPDDKLTSEEEELADWVQNGAASSVATSNEGLRHVITLATALLAGSVAFLKSNDMAPWTRTWG